MISSPTSILLRGKGKLPSLFAGVLLALSACSQAPDNTTHLVVVTPYTPQAAAGAIVSQTIPSNTGVTKIEVAVSDSATGQQLGSLSVAPGSALAIDVEPGPARLIKVAAIDAAGDTLFAGSTTHDLASNTSVTLPVDLFGKLLKGPSNLAAGMTVTVLDDAGATVNGTVDSTGAFRIALSQGMIRPYLLLAQDTSGQVVGAAITDAAGPTSLNPVTEFQAGMILVPANPVLVADWQSRWSIWTKTGSLQSSQLGTVDSGVQQALALSTIGEGQFQVGRTPSTTTWAMGTDNGLVTSWVGGSPQLQTSSGSVVASVSAGAIVNGSAILIAPYSGTGLTASNKTAVSGDWLLWRAGSTAAPLAITPPATLSGKTAAEIAAALRAIANEIEFAGYNPATVTGTTAQALASFLTTPLETIVLNGLGSTVSNTELSNLGATMASPTFDPAVGNQPPTFTGTPALVQTSVAVGGSLTLTGLGATDPNGNTVTTTYAWESSPDNATWSALTGQTAASLSVTSAEAHLYLRAVVTLSDGIGGVTSAATGSLQVGNTAPVFGTAPTIGGTAVVGATLSAQANASDVDGDTLSYTYTWKSNGVAIAGATGASFVVTAAQAHAAITLAVSANDGNGGTVAATTAAVTVANTAPAFVTVPSIGGTAKVGATLSAQVNAGDVDGDTLSYTYTWKSNGVAIAGATGASFVVTAAQAHAAITLAVSANDGNGGTVAATTAAVTVANTAPAFTSTPAIVQTSVVVGGTLSVGTVATSDADGDTVSLAYQWKGSSDGGVTYTAIAGATTSSFVVPQANAHQTLALDVIASDGNGGSTTATTTGLAVANSAPVLSGATLSTAVNTALPGTLTFSDPDGDTLIFTVQTAPTKGAVGAIPAAGTFTYTPNAGVFGTDFFTVQANDLFGGTSTVAQISLAILPTGVTKVWMGGDVAGVTDWSNGANWSPVGVPVASDGVMIPASAANQPALTASVACAGLYLESGASLTLGAFNLTDAGSLSMIGATISGTGTVILTGSGDLKAAALPNLDLQGVSYTLGSALNITGTLSSGVAFMPTLSSAGLQVSATAVNVDGLTLNNTPFTIGNGALTAFNNVTFTGFAATANQLTLNRTTAANVFTGLIFNNFPTTGSYIVANDTDGAATSSLLTLTGAMPQYGTPKVVTSGGFQVVWGLGNEDSDADTYTDAQELAAGSDPLLATSIPTGTNVPATNITAATTWNLAGGPYLVTGAVTLTGAGGLTIDPGVVVKFSAGAGITGAVGTTLNLNGTVNQPVILTSLNDLSVSATASGSGTPVPGDWSGVSLVAGGSLSNAEIRYAANGLTVTNASPSVNTVAVKDSAGYGIQVSSAALTAPAAPILNQITISNAGTQGLHLTASNGGSIAGTTVNGVVVTNSGSQGILIDTTGTAAGSNNSAAVTNFTVTNPGAEGVKISSAGIADTVTPTLGSGKITMPAVAIVPAMLVTGTAPAPTVTAVTCDGGSAGLQIDTAAGGLYRHNVIRKGGTTGVWLNTTGAPTLSTNTIVFNGTVLAGTTGGGINILASGAGTTIKHNLIRNNVADIGGGIYVANAGIWTNQMLGGHDLSIDDNLIVENGATGLGGGIYLAAGSLQLTNNTVSSNLSGAANGGGGLYIASGASSYLIQDIIAFNNDSQVGVQVGDDVGGPVTPTVYANLPSFISDGNTAITGQGGLNGDPLYIDNWYLSNALTLAPNQPLTSPAVDVGVTIASYATTFTFYTELLNFTTRTDGTGDTTATPTADAIDLGYHHQAAAPVVDAAVSTVVAASATIIPNSSTPIVITPRDAGGNPLGAGLQVVASVTGTATLAPELGTTFGAAATTMLATDQGDGTYTVILQSGATTGSSDTVSATVNGTALTATATVSW